jgi:hypothetical protein
MSVECRGCGAELIGEVNRCWNCGCEISPKDLLPAPPAAIATLPPDSAAPASTPQLNSPLATNEFTDVGAESADSESADSESADSETAVLEDIGQEPVDAILVETTSLFDEPDSLESASPFMSPVATRAIRVPTYRNPYLGNVCGWTAVCLGVVAWLISVTFTLGAAILALIGVIVASIGIRTSPSRSRIGMVLCTLALLTGVIALGLRAYVDRYGHYPWGDDADASPSALPLIDEDFDEWE